MPKGARGSIKLTCSKCDKVRDRKGRYCLKCHASYIREWRKTHPLSKEQRTKSSVRRKTNMRIQRGLLKPYPCEVCDSTERVEAHHDDYRKPYCVRWLCREHHVDYHKKERERKIIDVKRS